MEGEQSFFVQNLIFFELFQLDFKDPREVSRDFYLKNNFFRLRES